MHTFLYRHKFVASKAVMEGLDETWVNFSCHA